MKKLIYFSLIVLLFALCACTAQTPGVDLPPDQPSTGEKPVLTVMTHDSFSLSKELIAKFEADHNVTIQFVKGGDAGATLNRLLLTGKGGRPEADVFYGIDNSSLSRALEQNLFEPYQSPALKNVPTSFQLDAAFGALPIDYGDVCINYDKAWFEQKGLPLPGSYEDLLKEEYRGLLVVENPTTSTPGLSFLLASIATMGEEAGMDWWAKMKANDVQIASDWETAYYTNFSGSSGHGAQPMVVSYASSPAAELIYAEKPLEKAPTASLIWPGSCWRQIEFAGILNGTQNRALAEKFIDFLLSKEVQDDIPLQMFVYPVSTEAILPEAFQTATEIPQEAATLSPQAIAENRDAWVNRWMDLMQP